MIRTIYTGLLSGLAMLCLTACPPHKPGPGPGAKCVGFEPAVTPLTQYGAPASNSPGDQIFIENGIIVRVQEFQHSAGIAFSYAEVVASTASFGTGMQAMWTNNIGLEFDFSGVGFTPKKVTFDFVDHGGSENLSINGAPVFAGELSAAPSPMAGVTVSVVGNSAALTGDVDKFLVGGQEFILDQVCATP